MRQSAKQGSLKLANNSAINAQQRIALVERISTYTVGIALHANTCIGTGTLVEFDRQRLVITAEHVIADAGGVKNIRFWCRPPGPVIEKAAKDLCPSEIGRLTAGQTFPIETIVGESATDLAAIRLPSDFELPASTSNEFYVLDKSRQLAGWPEEEMDGLSLLYFGFPQANSLPLQKVGNREFHFLGCAHNACHYDKTLNTQGWTSLPSSFSPDKDFLLKYNLSEEKLNPVGFSGCGVWVGSEDPKSLVWDSEPLLVGVIHHHHPSSVLIATKVGRVWGIAKHTANLKGPQAP